MHQCPEAHRLLANLLQILDLEIDAVPIEGYPSKGPGSPWILTTKGMCDIHNDLPDGAYRTLRGRPEMIYTLLYVAATDEPYGFDIWPGDVPIGQEYQVGGYRTYTLETGSWIVFPSRLLHGIIDAARNNNRCIVSFQFKYPGST